MQVTAHQTPKARGLLFNPIGHLPLPRLWRQLESVPVGIHKARKLCVCGYWGLSAQDRSPKPRCLG